IILPASFSFVAAPILLCNTIISTAWLRRLTSKAALQCRFHVSPCSLRRRCTGTSLTQFTMFN
ncbi:hypothetical protein LINPERPRIM_LOCUS16182, partial [Linum perenne]